MKIIGLTGYKRTGKDTVADILEQYDYTRWSFADKLRQVCSDVLSIPIEYFTEDDLKDSSLVEFGIDMTPREVLIHIGTNGFREVNTNVWCDYIINQIKKSRCDKHVVTDVRFPNEYEAIKSLGGIIVRVERDGCVLGNDVKTAGLYNLGYDDIIDIQNNSTLDNLYSNVLKLLCTEYV